SYRERPLTARESQQADKVFQGTVPFWKVRLSNGLGFGQRPYTIPSPPGFYVIHIGPQLFDNPLAVRGGETTLIHELTHVWQRVNYFFPLNYVFASVWHQGQPGDAYAYTPGQPWSSYNVEQQAMIVEDWWNPTIGSGKEFDVRFPYIRDNIRGL